MRIVLDSNVIVSGFLVASGPSGRILDLVRHGRVTWILSDAILREVAGVLASTRIQKKYSVDPDSAALLLGFVGEEAIRVPGVLRVAPRSRDPDDDPILACALEGQAAYVVSGDQDLLELEQHEGILIVTPARFLADFER